jgi:hypothetical protein
MFKKNLFLFCALTSVCAPIAADSSHEEDTVDIAKGKKCCHCCSLTVTNDTSIGGNLKVGGSITANSIILPSGDALFNGLRNYAVFSNRTPQAANTDLVIPFGATPLFANSTAITNSGVAITLPTTGLFLVMYTVRVQFAANENFVGAAAFLQQTADGGVTFTPILQPAVESSQQNTAIGEVPQVQISGYAIVVTTSALNNQINVFLELGPNVMLVQSFGTTDANAQITILQLN